MASYTVDEKKILIYSNVKKYVLKIFMLEKKIYLLLSYAVGQY